MKKTTIPENFMDLDPIEKVEYVNTFDKFPKEWAAEIIRIIDESQDASERIIPEEGQTENEAWVDLYDLVMLNAINFLTLGDLLDAYSQFDNFVKQGLINPDGSIVRGREGDLWQAVIDMGSDPRPVQDILDVVGLYDGGNVTAVYWKERWNNKFKKAE